MTDRDASARRLVDTCFWTITREILPHIEKAVTDRQRAKRGSNGSDGLTEADVASLVLGDPLFAVAFGYRLDKTVRESLAETLESIGKEASHTSTELPLTRQFRRMFVERVAAYLRMTRTALEEVATAADAALHSLTIIEKAMLSDEKEDRQLRRLERAVDLAVANETKLDEVLELYGRDVPDAALDAACWLIYESHGKEQATGRNTRLRKWILEKLREPGIGPSAFFWAFLVVDDLPLESLEERKSKLLPSLGERKPIEDQYQRQREQCFCLSSLAKLKRRLDRPSAAVNDLVDSSSEVVVRGFWFAPADGMEYQPLNRDLHRLSQIVFALAHVVGVRELPSVAHLNMTLEDKLHHAQEINLGEQALFGKYLWSAARTDDVAQRFASEARELVRTVERHIRHRPQRPLNILIEGEPGAGKSYFVTNVLASTGIKPIEINASHFSRPEEIQAYFPQLTSQLAQFGNAAVFIDEVDTAYDGRRVFPFLIGPIWDGTFTDRDHAGYLKGVIWFFAASSSSWHAEPQNKGPDFLSRMHRRITLPRTAAGQGLMVFLGSLLAHHPSIRWVERGLLRHLYMQALQRPRDIEKILSTLEPAAGESCLRAQSELFKAMRRDLKMDGVHWDLDDSADPTAREWVAIANL